MSFLLEFPGYISVPIHGDVYDDYKPHQTDLDIVAAATPTGTGISSQVASWFFDASTI